MTECFGQKKTKSSKVYSSQENKLEILRLLVLHEPKLEWMNQVLGLFI